MKYNRCLDKAGEAKVHERYVQASNSEIKAGKECQDHEIVFVSTNKVRTNCPQKLKEKDERNQTTGFYRR